MAKDVNLNVDFKNLYLAPFPVKLIVGLIIAIAILVVAYFLVFQDQLNELSNKEKQEETLKAEYVKKAEKAANLPILKKEMEELQQAFQVLVKQLPTEKEVPNLIQQLHQAATNNGLIIHDLKPQSAVPDGSIVKLPYNISTEGTYEQLFMFSKDVGSLSRIIVLDNINIETLNGRSKGGMLKFNATANTFMANENQDGKQKGGLK